MTANLPPLERDCPDCTGPEADRARRAAQDTYGKWVYEECEAYSAYANGPDAPRFDVYIRWQGTAAYRELKDREPENVPEVGCVECDFTGTVLTEAGKQLAAFVRGLR